MSALVIKIADVDWRAAKAGKPSELLPALEKILLPLLDSGLTAERMAQLKADQVTLMAYLCLRREMREGGLVQLIYNGYGGFILHNPLAKAMRLWGLKDLSKLLYDCRRLYDEQGDTIEGLDLSEKDFMALYEQHPEMETVDDDFVKCEPLFTAAVCRYVLDHPENFDLSVTETTQKNER